MSAGILPGIDQNLYRLLIAHRSLGDISHSDWGDSERLAVLGRRVLPLVVADILSRQQPSLNSHELENEIERQQRFENIEAWTEKFQLREKILCAPEVKPTLKEQGETEQIFQSWLGAVYLQHGLNGVQAWIGPLVDSSFGRSTAQAPPQPLDNPPPIPPLGSAAQSKPAILPIFNQIAVQRRVQVEWKTTSTGASHAPLWYAECYVNGISKGQGTGNSKQVAKEQAAQNAYNEMGWAGAR